MATQSLKDFVEERLLAYDSTIDLTAGSPAQYQVVDPIVRRFEPDPFEMSIEKFIFSRLTQEFPTVNFREGSGVYDLLVKAASVLMTRSVERSSSSSRDSLSPIQSSWRTRRWMLWWPTSS